MTGRKPDKSALDIDSVNWTLKVISSKKRYFVMYQGKPFNLRVDYAKKSENRKTIFAQAGAAHRLAEHLNKLFGSTEFEVHIVTSTTPIQASKAIIHRQAYYQRKKNDTE
jgi:hypothetical protein